MRRARRGTIWAVAGLGLAAAGCGSSSAPAPSRAAATTGAAAVTAVAQAPTPAFAKTVRLAPVTGRVLIRIPGAADSIELRSAETVPIGTVIDTRAGTVRLTSATAPPTKLQTGNFFLGRFQVQQEQSLRGLTDLVIQDQLKRSVCSAQGQQATAAKLSARILGLLRGKAKGHFRTRGHFAAATVRGTEWGVRDRCDGTLTVVTRGVVAVRDFTRHKTVIVRTGQTYLAKAG
ncbi:MAG TPA: hypothetical protein VH279_10285 [Solirubrobacteraceae bacterium]|nr:hypothetical protein [Solirubrobacteraceae bacterium]